MLLTSCDYAVLYLIPKAFNNLGSIIPVTGNPFAVWNVRIAWRLPEPISPSIAPW